VNLTISRQYETAKKIADLNRAIHEELKRREIIRGDPEKSQQIIDAMKEEKRKAHQSEIESFNSEWAEKESALIEKHRAETEQFEHKWSAQVPNRYRKQSKKLMEMLEVERRLGDIADFDQASMVRKEVDAREQQEVADKQEQLIANYESSKHQLDKDQQAERELFEGVREHCRLVMFAKHVSEMDSVNNRGLVIDAKNQQKVKPKESGFDISAKAPVFAGSTVQKERQKVGLGQRLLPPLIAPNDPIIAKRKGKQQAAQAERNESFRRQIAEKRKEDNKSDTKSAKSSSRNGRKSHVPVKEKRRHSHRKKSHRSEPVEIVVQEKPLTPKAFDDLVQKIDIPDDLPEDDCGPGEDVFPLTQSDQYTV
jgi:hypothetical protein